MLALAPPHAAACDRHNSGRGRKQNHMNKLAPVFLSLLALSLAGCSGNNAAVGKWTIDGKATLSSFEAVIQDKLKAVPAEQREAAKSMMTAQIEKMQISVELKADQTVSMHAEMPGGAHEDAVGTWSLAGDQLTFKTTKKGGKTEEVKTGTFKGQTIEMTEESGGMKMTLVLKRAN